ncbi:GntR family transcriptional regulator [Bacillus sp. ISL-34]|uniref:GntR family transcriptional regulator n=1 Tax=Bacillus sp. ISL-34 TaxID=2819121 RepID=UPI001BE90E93|nr:GntR family transcriptional regulator [Bacillus sp. ISL-34]MBT2647425.1 GntR family transcriptional regulator [Bacillus sp. ISL-34]
MVTNHYQYFIEQIEHYSSKPLREAIFFVIKNAIIEGIFLPGDRLTEDDIAQQFICSRTPVREALRKLEQENLLQVKPGIGMVIPMWILNFYSKNWKSGGCSKTIRYKKLVKELRKRN